MAHNAGETAVVLGAGMAGLLAARALAESFDQVLLVDRDDLDGGTAHRRAVPQGAHAHALLARGQQILDDFFPGLVDDLVEGGVPAGDMAADLRWYFGGKRLAQSPAGLRSVSATRPVLEAHIRSRVAKLPNVAVRAGTSVDGLRVSADGRRIAGVTVRAHDRTPEDIAAELVVDATGRGGRTPRWLEDLGYARPHEDRVAVDLAYTTRRFVLRRDPYGHDLSINPVAYPGNPRGGFFPRLADGTSMLSLTGMLGDHPPTDDQGFLEFARTLAAPEIHDAIHDAEPVDRPVTFRFPASVRRRYERLTDAPDGLIAVGDGVCSVNPVYGQGMTMAAMQAEILREHGRAGPVRPLAFYRAIAPVVDGSWDTAVGADLMFPGVAGPRSWRSRAANAYLASLHAGAAVDGELTATFFRVAGLVDPPSALVRPGVVGRVLRARRPRARTTAPVVQTDATSTGRHADAA